MFNRRRELSFSAALRDIEAREPRDRLAAAEVLGQAESEEEKDAAWAALAPAISDRRPEVRATACYALSELGRPEGAELIALCLDDQDAEVRQSAAIALGSLGGDEAFAPLLQALREGPPDLRFQAATSLVEVDAESAYEPLLAALSDEDPEVLGAVALALGTIGRTECGDRLAPLLTHEDKGCALDAAYALAQLGDRRAEELLKEAIADPEGGWDAAEALETLGGNHADHYADLLRRQAGEPRVKLKIAGHLLSQVEGASDPDAARALAHRVLLAGLQARRQDLRGLALQVIGEVGGAWARPHLEALRRSFRARSMREEIDEALSQIRGRSSADS